MDEEKIKAAREVAMRALARSACTQAQLEAKLARASIPPEVVALIVGELKERGWLNDPQFVRDWVADRADRKRYGRRRLQSELRARGISEEVLKEAMPPASFEEELQRARAAVARRWPPGCMANLTGTQLQTEKRRCASFLQRRGFEQEIIEKVLAERTSK